MGREAILQNSALEVFLASNDDSTARYISDRLGTEKILTARKDHWTIDSAFCYAVCVAC